MTVQKMQLVCPDCNPCETCSGTKLVERRVLLVTSKDKKQIIDLYNAYEKAQMIWLVDIDKFLPWYKRFGDVIALLAFFSLASILLLTVSAKSFPFLFQLSAVVGVVITLLASSKRKKWRREFKTKKILDALGEINWVLACYDIHIKNENVTFSIYETNKIYIASEDEVLNPYATAIG